MKAAKPLIAIAILMIVAAGAYLLVSRSVPTQVLLSNVTASPIKGEPGDAGVYMTIRNTGGPDRLVAVRSIVAQRALLEHSTADSGLPIPAGSEPSLSSDGAFVRLSNLRGDLRDGRMIPITLLFENAGEQRTQARLVMSQAPEMAEGANHMMEMSNALAVLEGEPAPRLSLDVEPDGDGWKVRLATEDFTFSRDGSESGHVPGAGHGHLYLGGLKLQRLYEPEARIGALPPGNHEVRVTLNTNDHRPYMVDGHPVVATVRITAD